jgi:acyl carrier protein
MEQSKNEVLEIIAKSLEVDKERITVESTVDSLEEWDSLGHLSILVSLDKKFQGRLAGIKEMASVTSVNSILKILKNNNLI